MNKHAARALLIVMCATLLEYCNLTAQVIFTSSNLPIIKVSTKTTDPIPDEPKIAATMQIIANSNGKINTINDKATIFDGNIGIERRGNSSQYFAEKKPYTIELRDEKDQDLAAELLGMPKESDWVLLAPYADKSLIRDALAYQWASAAMEWAPRTRFVELVLNGIYQGVYVLLEQLKRDKNRVDINKLEQKDNNANNITGGYIISLDVIKEKDGIYPDGWYSPYEPPYGLGHRIFYQHVYPKTGEITAPQKEYIKNYITSFESALKSGDFKDENKGYRKYIDVPSFVNFLLVNELTKNTDALRLSTFMYKDRDGKNGVGKLKMGPVWDFNLSLANTKNCAGYDPTGWQFEFNKICVFDLWVTNFWYNRLMEDPRFVRELKERWKQLRRTDWSDDRLIASIDAMTNSLAQAQVRNYQRWQILDKSVWPYNDIRYSYQAEIDFLKNWLRQRIEWLDKNIAAYPEDFKTDLELTQTVDNTFPKPGETITFTYTIRNNGNATAEMVFIKTSLSSGLIYLNAYYTVPHGYYDAAIRNWIVNSLAPNEIKTLTISAKVAENIRGKLVNFSQIQTQSIGDIDSSAGNNITNEPLEDDEAATTLTVNVEQTPPTPTIPVINENDKIDLEINLTVDKTKLTIYQNINYTVTVVNKGKRAAKNVKINCPVPYNMAYVTHKIDKGKYQNWEGIWSIDNIEPNEKFTFTGTFFVLNPNPNTYLVQVVEASPTDIDSSPNNMTNEIAREDDEAVIIIDNNKASDNNSNIESKPNTIDIDIDIMADQVGLPLFNNITYKVIASNLGNAVATNVQVEFRIPEKMAYVSHKMNLGNYTHICKNNPSCQIWSIPAIGPNEKAILEITLYVLDDTKPITAAAKLVKVEQAQTNYSNDQVLLTIEQYTKGRSENSNASIEAFFPVRIINIYPVPTMDWVHFSMYSAEETTINVQFYDSMAQCVWAKMQPLIKGDNQIEIDVSALPSGLYHVMLSSGTLKSSPISVLIQR